MNPERLSETAVSPTRSGTRITYWLAALFLLLGLAVCVGTFRLVAADHQAVHDNAVRGAVLLADSYALHLKQALSDTDVLARFVAFESQGTHPLSLKEMVARRLIEPGDATLVTIADVGGWQTESWPATPASRIVLADRAHFVAQQNHPDTGLYIGAPVVGRISGQWTLQLSRRINRPDGAFAGVVVISKSPDFLSAGFISSANVGAHGIGAVFRWNDVLLSRTDAAAGTTADGPALNVYDPRSRGSTWEGPDPVTDQARIYARQSVPGYPLVALIGLAEADVYRHHLARAHVYFAVGGLILCALLVAAVPTILYARDLASRNAITREMAETDALTGLGNRHKLAAFLQARLDGSSNEPVALLAIDLHRFGQVNETMGYDVGDALLRQVADRVRCIAGHTAVAARTGGDEFMIGLHGGGASSLALAAARALIDQFAVAFGLRGRTYPLRVSIGIASTELGACDSATLRANATAAMDVAKKSTRRSGHSEYAIYSQLMADTASRELGTMDGLVNALNNGGLSIRLMPVITLANRRQTGVMSELFWRSPQAGLMHESCFMGIARRKGLAYALQSHALREASGALARHERSSRRDLALHVRISAALLADSNTIPDLTSLPLPPDRLRLILYDFTPDQLSDSTLAKIVELRKQGASAFLEINHGGECSLDIFSHLTLDGLFISPALLRHVPANRSASAIARALITLCGELGLRPLVGGVDSKAQYDWLPAAAGLECFGAYLGGTLRAADLDIVSG